MAEEITYEVHWDGPYEWRKGIEKCGNDHVLQVSLQACLKVVQGSPHNEL